MILITRLRYFKGSMANFGSSAGVKKDKWIANGPDIVKFRHTTQGKIAFAGTVAFATLLLYNHYVVNSNQTSKRKNKGQFDGGQ